MELYGLSLEENGIIAGSVEKTKEISSLGLNTKNKKSGNRERFILCLR
jgi:hypothetical protein